jgi:hypothetical protein
MQSHPKFQPESKPVIMDYETNEDGKVVAVY